MIKPKPKRKTADRFAVLNAFVDFTAAELRRSELLVWWTLYRDTKDTGTATTSQRDIANRCRLDRKTVERAVRSLTERGLLKVVRRGGFRQGSSSYRVFPVSRERLHDL
ncbi:MAG: helix-turn-helix domain-containing protein [Candidatus Paceibacterota bacterium]